MSDSLKNQFLVALPSLSEDYFQNTISLLIEHDERGAFGLVINQPLENSIQDFFPKVPEHISFPVLEGGPVEQNSVFFLHPSGPVFESTTNIGPGISLTTSSDFIDAIIEGRAPEKSVLILGYAGWSEEQLESELGNNIWLVTPSNADILFNSNHEEKPKQAANLMGIDLNLISLNLGHD